MNLNHLLHYLNRLRRPSQHPRPWDLANKRLDEIVPAEGIPVINLSGWGEDVADGGILDADGTHRSPTVESESRNALHLHSNEGWCVWHDGAADWPDVITALVARESPRVYWVKESRFAVRIPS